MVEYLDRDIPLKHGLDDETWVSLPAAEKFSLLAPSDRQAILEQARECTKDFSYAARNYFWIVNQKKQDQLMSLWQGQHLILQKWYDLKEKYPKKAQKIIIVKARRLGCSYLIEAMLAWRSMFFPNTRGLVVSVDEDSAADLFSIMAHIYTKLPWWLKPMLAAYKYREGIFFDNPDEQMRTYRPGLNSKVEVQFASQVSGVGQGRAIDALHCSEVSDWPEGKAEDILEADLTPALDENNEVFGFLESTGRGAGTYFHKLWKTCERRMERAEWYPVFLPWFFETKRVLAPPGGWHLQKPEAKMRDRVAKEWAQCSHCREYRRLLIHGELTIGTECPECGQGTFQSVMLGDDQLFWKQDKREQAEEKGKPALKKHLQEFATTPEEAFQLQGNTFFDDRCMEWVNFGIRDPIKAGKIYRGSTVDNEYHPPEIHGASGKNGRCYVKTCKDDHRHDDILFQVWEEPIPGRRYSVGVDPSDGLGEDYGVIWVNKIGERGGPDEQVAMFRDNNTSPKELAYYANVIGRWYNDALMSVEYNVAQACGNDLVDFWQYPNLFQWSARDAVQNRPLRWHWYTRVNTKPLLNDTAKHWLQGCVWIVRAKEFAHEMTVYTKDRAGSVVVRAIRGENDDVLMAAMIALYCPHERDSDESGRIPVMARVEEEKPARYKMVCTRCHFTWGAQNPELEYRCPVEGCGCIRLRAESLEANPGAAYDHEQLQHLLAGRSATRPRDPTHDSL